MSYAGRAAQAVHRRFSFDRSHFPAALSCPPKCSMDLGKLYCSLQTRMSIDKSLTLRLFNIDVNSAPFSLQKACNTQNTANHVAGEYGKPNIQRFKRAELRDQETNAQRYSDLGNDRYIQRAFRVAGTLQSAGVCQSDGY